MTLRRFYVPASDLETHERGARVMLSMEETRHLRDVLRLRAGDEARIFDGEGGEYACRVVEVGRGREGATLEVSERIEPPSAESSLELTLAVALLKGEKFDLVVQKATELGATRIIAVATKRADVRVRDEADRARRIGRWQRLALEAAKQSGRARVPLIEGPFDFEKLVDNETSASALRVMFAERGGDSLASLGDTRKAPITKAVALVGPEGGWETKEIERARQTGWRIITLGGRILRAETAAMTVAVLMQHRFGDLF